MTEMMLVPTTATTATTRRLFANTGRTYLDSSDLRLFRGLWRIRKHCEHCHKVLPTPIAKSRKWYVRTYTSPPKPAAFPKPSNITFWNNGSFRITVCVHLHDDAAVYKLMEYCTPSTIDSETNWYRVVFQVGIVRVQRGHVIGFVDVYTARCIIMVVSLYRHGQFTRRRLSLGTNSTRYRFFFGDGSARHPESILHGILEASSCWIYHGGLG